MATEDMACFKVVGGCSFSFALDNGRVDVRKVSKVLPGEPVSFYVELATGWRHVGAMESGLSDMKFVAGLLYNIQGLMPAMAAPLPLGGQAPYIAPTAVPGSPERPLKRLRMCIQSVEIKLAGLELLHKDLVDTYSDITVHILSGLHLLVDLPLPHVTVSVQSPGRRYTFVGRPKLQELYDLVTAEDPNVNVIDFTGCIGAGKSCILATLAGFLHVKGQVSRPVVYLLGMLYNGSPFETLVPALLLALATNEPAKAHLLKVISEEGRSESDAVARVWDWISCEATVKFGLTFVFIIDEFNKLAPDKQDLVNKAVVQHSHVLLKGYSIRSEDMKTRFTTAHDFGELITLNKPFTTEEAELWLSAFPVKNYNSAEMEYYTGWIPRLMKFMQQDQWNRATQYIHAHLGYLIDNMKREHFSSLMKFLTGSEVHITDCAVMDMTCFYVELDEYKRWRGRCVSPFFEAEAHARFRRRKQQELQKDMEEEMKVWKAAAFLDASNPARFGWTVEEVTIDVAVIKGCIGTLEFKDRIVRYDFKCPLASHLQAETQGVLFVPLAYNEAHVDLVYRVKKGKSWVVTGIQISVAEWTSKLKKCSHLSFVSNYKSWVPAGEGDNAEVRFMYILRTRLDVSGGVNPTPKTCNTAWGRATLLDGVTVSFHQFKDVDASLGFIDDMEDLAPPVSIQSAQPSQCRFTRSTGKRCKIMVKGSDLCHVHTKM